MTPDDVTKRAAKWIVARAVHEHDANDSMSGESRPAWGELNAEGREAYSNVGEAVAQALDAAGLLATPERIEAERIDYLSGKYPEFIHKRDAAVAARALRDAADKVDRDRRIHDASCGESPAQTHEQAGRDHGVTIGLRQAVRHLNERADRIEQGD